jgi:hypothetical protein
MLDINLTASLLKAVPPKSQVLFIGDIRGEAAIRDWTRVLIKLKKLGNWEYRYRHPW